MRTFRFLLLLLVSAGVAPAIDTPEVLLRHGDSSDAAVRLWRDGAGNMVFEDEFTSATLQMLARNPTSHGALEGLSADDHPHYLDASRHLGAHTAATNGALAIPADPAGNTSLGTHVQSADLHLQRNADEAIGGAWSFAGSVSAAGGGVALGPSDFGEAPALRFSEGAGRAELAFHESEGELRADAPLAVPELRLGGALDGAVEGVPTATLSGFASVEGIAAADLLSASESEAVAGRWAMLGGVDVSGAAGTATVRLTGVPSVVLHARSASSAVMAAGTAVQFAGHSGSEVAVVPTGSLGAGTPFAGVLLSAVAPGATSDVVVMGVAPVTASGPIATGEALTWNGTAAEPGSPAFCLTLEPLPGAGTGSVLVWVFGGYR